MAEIAAQKIESALKLKETANAFYSNNDITQALRCYHETLLQIKGIDSSAVAVPSAKLSSETKEQIKIITASIYNNMCACYIKQSKWSKCVDTSKKVLELDEKNLKALYRCAFSLFELNKLDECTEMIKKAVYIDGKDQGIRDIVQKLKIKQEQLNGKYKDDYRGMFTRK